MRAAEQVKLCKRHVTTSCPCCVRVCVCLCYGSIFFRGLLFNMVMCDDGFQTKEIKLTENKYKIQPNVHILILFLSHASATLYILYIFLNFVSTCSSTLRVPCSHEKLLRRKLS